ncbi:beta strand repeat-containing protein [Pelosinus propionicus]|uniref:beta strand repeat-containing protein n=1 Tax=Pelosinus propionicus TaxID=380084 RepID=UPI001113B5DF|nr:MBG domain-containing protein [Pelosinus propionicus]
MQRKWKRRWQRLTKTLLPPLAAGLLFLSSYHPAFANPTGGTVVSGSAAITASGATTTVNQTSDKASLNWQSFSIDKGETVNFIQPSASSVALNRVIGSDASAIYGTLTANGKVFLINPNGILFAPGSQVSTGGLVASTLNITDSDFLNGNYTFSGTATNGVTNQGTITATSEAVLLGAQVKNEGLIAAKVTGLGAGKEVSLDFSGDRLVNLTVDTGAAGGSATNSGTITAAGGLVVMTAGTRDALLNTVVNNSGVIRAQSVKNDNGVIRLEGSTVINAGTLDASGKTAGEIGGTVKLLGDTVTVKTGSTIDVAGDAGGGTALLGGNYQGGGSEYQATNTTVEQGAAITADALTTGNGGQVVVWAKDTTKFAGAISAKGGSLSGDGGSVETSGKQTLQVADTASVNTTATQGQTGNWLLDPYNLTISAATDSTSGFTASGDDSVISVTTLQSALANNNVTISTGSGGSQAGDITVAAPVSWASGTTLTLSAYRNIYINAAVTASGANAGLALVTGTGGSGSYSLGSGASITLSGSGAAFGLNGTAYTVINNYSGSSYSSTGALQALQNIGSNLAGNYVLGIDIDASSTSSWNSGAGFVPIGTYGNAFTGTFDGLGHTVSALTINLSSSDAVVYAGLFGYTGSGATLRNVGLWGGSVSSSAAASSSYVGGLVGFNNGGSITNSYSSGSVSSSSYYSYAGGLVGDNNSGTITNSYSTGSVSSSSYYSYSIAGGLVGRNVGSITNSYSTGSVSSSSSSSSYYYYSIAGGLVGDNVGSITNSYSSGSVSSSYSYAGGLVGYNSGSGTITSSYWDVDTSGQTNGIGADYNNQSGNVTGLYSLSASLAADPTRKSALAATSYNWGSDITDTGGSSAVWRIYDGYTYPLLRSFLTAVTVSSASTTYNGAANGTASSYTLSDSNATSGVSGSLSYTTGSKNAGTYSTADSSLTLSGLYSNQQGYDISYDGTLTITPAALTVTNLTASNKVYDGTTAAIVSGTLSGVIGTDTVTLGGGTFSDKNAGDGKTVTVTLTGADAGNYTVNTTTTADITQAALSVTASNAAKTYNGLAYSGGSGVTYSGFVNNEDSSVLTGALAYSGSSQGAINAGSYDITASGLASGNYTITYVNGTLTVNPAALTVTANNASKTYDGLAYSGGSGVTYSGFVNGEDNSVLDGTLAYGGTAQGASLPGSYTITSGGLTAANYAITFVNGTLTITGRMADPTYDGAVLHAEHLAGAVPGGAAFSGLSGYLTGSANLYAPLTIIGSGINTGGYPLALLPPVSPATVEPTTGGATE